MHTNNDTQTLEPKRGGGESLQLSILILWYVPISPSVCSVQEKSQLAWSHFSAIRLLS